MTIMRLEDYREKREAERRESAELHRLMHNARMPRDVINADLALKTGFVLGALMAYLSVLFVWLML